MERGDVPGSPTEHQQVTLEQGNEPQFGPLRDLQPLRTLNSNVCICPITCIPYKDKEHASANYRMIRQIQGQILPSRQSGAAS